MADAATIKARIRALQARTKAAGCTEAEAAAAAEAVVRLMAESGLSDADVATGKRRVKLTLRPDARDLLHGPIASATRCQRYTITGSERHIVYLGREPWPECAAWLHEVVFGAVARASRDFAKSPEGKKRRTARTKAKAREAFITGFCLRLRDRLWGLVQHSPERDADLALAKQALDGVRGLSEGKPIAAKKPEKGFGGAFLSGHAQADGVNLAWGINGPAATLKIGGPR